MLIKKLHTYAIVKSMDNDQIVQLKNLIQQALNLQSHLSLDTRVLTPVNLVEERVKFLKSKTYNPQFKYIKKPNPISEDDITKLQTKLVDLDLPTDLSDFYLTAIEQMKTQLKTVQAIGTANFASFSGRLFTITQTTTDLYLNQVPQVDFNTKTGHQLLDAEKIRQRFEVVIRNYALSDVDVILDDFNPYTVRTGSKRLIVGSGIHRYDNNVERLITHEIESHIIRRKSLIQMENILHRFASFDKSILFSEGLAVYNEINQKKITKSAMNTYIQRLQAVNKLDLGFRDIYNYLINFIKPNLAFVMTYRVKRGMTDTSLPGGYEKDAYYLMGYFEVKDFVDKGGDLKNLYAFAVPELEILLKKYNLASDKEPLLPKFLP
jgi:hypothetical protein